MGDNENNHVKVPKDHPRITSLMYRHKIIEGMKNLVVAEAGLIAHGRGECFDYILGEKTNDFAIQAINAAVAQLLLAQHPVISVNGNVAALCPEDLVLLSNTVNASLEINIFYRKKGRVNAIKKLLEEAGGKNILGTDESIMVEIEELSSNRRNVDPKGIKISDVVFIPLEDGDRTEALKKLGKTVIAVDLNPLSRTAIWANITIVDNIIRTLPIMTKIALKYKNYAKEQLKKIVNDFNNKKNIQNALDFIIKYINLQKEKAFDIIH